MKSVSRSVVLSALCAAGVLGFSNAQEEPAARPPATSLAPPGSAPSSPDEHGFIRRWLVLEPVKSEGLTQSVVCTAVEAETITGWIGTVPQAGQVLKSGEEELKWHATDTKAYNLNLFHFAYALGKPTSNVAFRAVTVIHCPEELEGVRLAIGSNAASVWWVNGEEVIGLYNDRQCTIDDGISKRLTLKKGPNIVQAVVINGGGATDFCARFLDADEKPLKGYTVDLKAVAETGSN